jgi:hypothetical protein
VDDPDAIGQGIGLLQILRREEDGDAFAASQARDLVP